MSGLAAAIDELELQPDGEAIALAIRLRDLLDAKISRAVGIYDARAAELSNGVLKCTRHHHIGHRSGWTEKLEPDGTLHLTAPDGRTWTTTPPGVLPRLPE